MPGVHLKIDNPDDNGEGEVKILFHRLMSMNDPSLPCRSVAMDVMCSWATSMMRKKLRKPLIMKDGSTVEILGKWTVKGSSTSLAELRVSHTPPPPPTPPPTNNKLYYYV